MFFDETKIYVKAATAAMASSPFAAKSSCRSASERRQRRPRRNVTWWSTAV